MDELFSCGMERDLCYNCKKTVRDYPDAIADFSHYLLHSHTRMLDNDHSRFKTYRSLKNPHCTHSRFPSPDTSCAVPRK